MVCIFTFCSPFLHADNNEWLEDENIGVIPCDPIICAVETEPKDPRDKKYIPTNLTIPLTRDKSYKIDDFIVTLTVRKINTEEVEWVDPCWVDEKLTIIDSRYVSTKVFEETLLHRYACPSFTGQPKVIIKDSKKYIRIPTFSNGANCCRTYWDISMDYFVREEVPYEGEEYYRDKELNPEHYYEW